MKKQYIDWKYKKHGTPLKVLIELFPNKQWNYSFLLYDPVINDILYFNEIGKILGSISILNIKMNSMFPWNWNYISRNPNITLSDILAYPELPWSWDYISQNPSITTKDILKNLEKNWDWGYISNNEFLYNNTVYNNEIKKDIKSRRERVKHLNIFGDLDKVINKYVGYV